MSNKTKSTQPRKKSAKDTTKNSAKPGTSTTGRVAGRTADHTAGAGRGVAFDIGTLVSEVRDLRTLRDRYQALLNEHNGLLGTLKDLSTELGTSARKAWTTYRTGDAEPAGHGDFGPGSSTAAAYRTRVRTSSDLVDSQYEKFLATLPASWASKEELCKAAGLDPREANTAFRRLVTGFKRDGRDHPPRLESNGKRGTEGRYRKK